MTLKQVVNPSERSNPWFAVMFIPPDFFDKNSTTSMSWPQHLIAMAAKNKPMNTNFEIFIFEIIWRILCEVEYVGFLFDSKVCSS